MSLVVSRDPESGIISVRAAFEISPAGWKTVFEKIYESAERDKPLLILWDLTEVTKMPGWPDMEELIATVRKRRPDLPGRSAIVATDEFIYDLSRVLQVRLEERVIPELEVFRDVSEAEKWLSDWREVAERPFGPRRTE